MRNDKEKVTGSEEMVTISRAEYEEFQGQRERISALEQQIALLTEAIRLSRQKRFGASSERSSEDTMEQLSLLFNEAEVYADQTAKEDDNRVTVAAHKRHRKHEYTLDELPEKIQWLMEQLRLSRQKRFGASSEQTSEDTCRQRNWSARTAGIP